MEPDYEIMGETLIVNVPQELDHHSAKMVKEYSDQIIRDKSIKNIVFDFSNSTFMDSSGIGMIMGRYRVVKEKGICWSKRGWACNSQNIGNIRIVQVSRNLQINNIAI